MSWLRRLFGLSDVGAEASGQISGNMVYLKSEDFPPPIVQSGYGLVHQLPLGIASGSVSGYYLSSGAVRSVGIGSWAIADPAVVSGALLSGSIHPRTPWTRDEMVAQWILEGTPFTSGVQLGVLTDWLKENYRTHEADFLEQHWSGK